MLGRSRAALPLSPSTASSATTTSPCSARPGPLPDLRARRRAAGRRTPGRHGRVRRLPGPAGDVDAGGCPRARRRGRARRRRRHHLHLRHDRAAQGCDGDARPDAAGLRRLGRHRRARARATATSWSTRSSTPSGTRPASSPASSRARPSCPEPVFDVPHGARPRSPASGSRCCPGRRRSTSSILDHPDRDRLDLSSLRLAVTGRRRGARSSWSAACATSSPSRPSSPPTGSPSRRASVTMCRPDDDPETIATTSGRAIPGVEVRSSTTTAPRWPAGEPGEVVCRGLQRDGRVLRGPRRRRAEAIDADGWLHTGDVGVMDERGYLRITDRKKDMFIVGGFNVYPAEIENAILRAIPTSPRSRWSACPTSGWARSGVAFVVPRPGASIDPDELCRLGAPASMANYKVPRPAIVVDALPVNASGKVLKYELRETGLTWTDATPITRAIVTGAGSGIGRATARRLAAEGAAVACLDVKGHDDTAAGHRGRRRSGLGLRVRRDRRRRGGAQRRPRVRGARRPERRVQRRRDRQLLPDRDPGPGGVRPHHRGEPAGDVPRLPLRVAAPARSGWRRDREHDVGVGHRGQPVERGVRGVEGRRPDADQGAGGRVPPPRRSA